MTNPGQGQELDTLLSWSSCDPQGCQAPRQGDSFVSLRAEPGIIKQERERGRNTAVRFTAWLPLPTVC